MQKNSGFTIFNSQRLLGVVQEGLQVRNFISKNYLQINTKSRDKKF
jgi:hypothetical protein